MEYKDKQKCENSKKKTNSEKKERPGNIDSLFLLCEGYPEKATEKYTQ